MSIAIKLFNKFKKFLINFFLIGFKCSNSLKKFKKFNKLKKFLNIHKNILYKIK